MRIGYCFTAVLAVIFLMSAVGVEAASVSSQGDNSVTVILTPDRSKITETTIAGLPFRAVQGLGTGIGPGGRPDLPTQGYWVAIPDGMEPRLTIVRADYEDLPGNPIAPAPKDTLIGRTREPSITQSIDRPFYRTSGWYPEELVTIGEPERFRNQRAVPVRFHPYRTTPSSGLLRKYREVEVRIDFVPARDEQRESGARKQAREPARDESKWETLYQGTILNYDQGRSFRSRPARSARRHTSKTSRVENEYKLFVEKSGVYKIPFSELSLQGLGSGTSLDRIAIYRRGFSEAQLQDSLNPFTEVSLPTRVLDKNNNGTFENGDTLLCYLPGFRQDRMERDFEDRFAVEAVYFLSVEAEARPAAVRSADLGLASPTSLVSFADSIRWEIDAQYDGKSPTDTIDHYFAGGNRIENRTTQIELGPIDPSEMFGVKGMVVSTVSEGSGALLYHRYRLETTDGTEIFNFLNFGERADLSRTGRVHDPVVLTEGVNNIRYFGSRGRSVETTTGGVGGHFDWYEIHANFLYQAHNGALHFSTGDGSGPVAMTVSGFPSAQVHVWDITDPYNASVIEAIATGGGSDFSITVEDTIGAQRHAYRAYAASEVPVLKGNKIVADLPTSLAASEADYLMVSHEDFFAAIAPLEDFRESGGYTVERARISDVYDEFNGGVKDPVAIRNYVRYGFMAWDKQPLFLLLVGDGFEDYKNIAVNRGNSGDDFDFVPAYPGYTRQIFGSGDNWDASDPWFGFLDGDRDALLDVIVGRMPVKLSSEAETIVAKTIAYEDFKPDDTWRNRMIFMADDRWVFDSGCIEDGRQPQFETNSRVFVENLLESSARDMDTATIYLSTSTDAVHEMCPCISNPNSTLDADVDCVIAGARAAVGGRMFDQLNGPGALFVNFQGHGNRNVLTHEVVVRQGPDYRNNTSNDIDDNTNNEGRPYIFAAYGCSISEFDRFTSFGYEALTEVMIRSDKGGAVAAFGSTGIEFLSPNLALNSSILKYFYQSPGVVPSADVNGNPPPWYQGVPRWSLGEIITLGLNDFAVRSPLGSPDTIRRYAIFGDPALMMDASIPTFEVALDGVLTEDGAVVTSDLDGSPVEVTAQVRDEVAIPRDSIAVFAGSVALDTALYVVSADTMFHEGHAWNLAFSLDLSASESVDYTLRAVDLNGRVATFVLKTTAAMILTVDGQELSDGALISPRPTIRAEITTPRPVSSNEIDIAIDGVSLLLDSLISIDQFRWIAVARPELSGGTHVLKVTVGVQSIEFTVRVDATFRVADLLNYPNPAEDGTGFYYELTDQADEVSIEVFTVNGRRVRTFRDLAARAGYNENPGIWDGTDADGDRVANGVYIYRLQARRADDRVEAMGKAVFLRTMPPEDE